MDIRYQSLLNTFKWLRKTTIDLFRSAEKSKSLFFCPNYILTTGHDRNILYQFQCILTSTDTKVRIISGHKNREYGVLVLDDKCIKKIKIPENVIIPQLEEQLSKLSTTLKDLSFDDETEKILKSLILHEMLHQGQLVTLFRLKGIHFPEEFDKTWDLSGKS